MGLESVARTRRLISVLISGAALAATGAGHAWAQQAATPATPGANAVQEVVVTARRVSENVQNVPVSVGTIGHVELENRQISNLDDVKSVVVGLSITRTTTPGGGIIGIRGLSNTSIGSPGTDNSIGFYVDGVYIARQRGAGTDVPDLAQVEVLRGPQGTLFGRNSDAGAISFTTNAPTQKFGATADILYGSYDRFRAYTVLNLPLVNGLAARLVYQHSEDGGDVENTTQSPGHTVAGQGSFIPEKDYNGFNSDSFTARLRYTGVNHLQIDYKFDMTNDTELGGVNQIYGFLPSSFASTLATLLPLQLPGAVTPSFTRLSRVAEDGQSELPITNWGHALTAEYAINDSLSVKTIDAYRYLNSPGSFDLDGGDWRTPTATGLVSLCVACTYLQTFREHQFSSENQIIGRYGPLNFIVGAYYFQEHTRYVNPYTTLRVFPETPAAYIPITSEYYGRGFGDFTIGENSIYDTRSYAGYGHVEYAVTQKLKLSGGVRYTEDQKQTDDLRSFGTGVSSVSADRVTYDGAANYFLTPDKMIYAKYSTGFVSGGIISSVTFKPETSDSAEGGFKFDLWDHKARLNAAGYYTWVDNRQASLPSVSPTQNPILAAAGYQVPYPLGVLVYNIPGTTTIDGFELEGQLNPVRGLQLSANYSLNQPHTPNGTLWQIPKEQFAFSGRYETVEFSNGSDLALILDGDYRSDYYGAGLNSPSVFQGEVPAALRPGYATSAAYLSALRSATTLGDYWLVNVRATLERFPIGPSTRAELSFYIQNIFNEEGPLYAANYGPSINGEFERPRQYGFEVKVQY